MHLLIPSRVKCWGEDLRVTTAARHELRASAVVRNLRVHGPRIAKLATRVLLPAAPSNRESAMPDNTFDIVSKIDLQEVSNAIQHAIKEITTRFDLKDSKSSIALEGKDAIILHSIDEYKLKAINDILQANLVKRGISLKGLTYAPIENALGATAKQKITLQQAIPIEKAKDIVKLIKNSKKK